MILVFCHPFNHYTISDSLPSEPPGKPNHYTQDTQHLPGIVPDAETFLLRKLKFQMGHDNAPGTYRPNLKKKKMQAIVF